jgi:photosystem II stability/assembly factor-like uncharacterized protein
MKGHTKSLLMLLLTTLALIVINFPPLASAKIGQQKGSQKADVSSRTGDLDDQLRSKKPKVKPTPNIEEEPDEANENDPDRPPFAQGLVNHAEYLRRRQEWVNMKMGVERGKPFDPMARARAIEEMKTQEGSLAGKVKQGLISPRVLSGGWTNIGPFLANGQTNSTETPVSGRITAIAVDPTNPDRVFVGAAQGGVYRSLNGGQTWTQIFDSAATQVVGAIAIAPSNPEIVYVGTGEAGGSADSFIGIGFYRIDNASTTADLTGPINPLITTGTTTAITYAAFNGRSISEILVAPNDPSVVFVATHTGAIANPGQSPGNVVGPPPLLALRGLFRVNNATGPIAGMTIAKLTVTTAGGLDVPSTGNRSIMDIAFDPADNTGNTIVAFVNGTGGATTLDGGIWRTTDALTAGTFTQRLVPVSSNIRGELAVTRVGGVTTMYLASAETGLAPCNGTTQGSVRKSVDGGVTWSARLGAGNGFCGGQCFYDIAVDVSSTDPNLVMIGGNVPPSPPLNCTRNVARSTDGGATFTESSPGLHADSHVLTFAPSNPKVVYTGNDGGVWRSNDGGQTWNSLNNRTFVATQFQSIASHATERYFLLGGTQDNGTELLEPNDFSQRAYDGWRNADFGDGGYARIDQTSTDPENVVMYHTYFNQTNAQAIARVTARSQARKGNWPFFGCGFSGVTVNGFDCAATTAILFYAPFELGPAGVAGATGQTVYWGADTLYRSLNQAATFVVASQKPIVSGVAITTIAIGQSNDNARLVGLTNGTVWGTSNGAAVLVNVTPAGAPTRVVGRVAIDPNNAAVAYIGFSGFFNGAFANNQHIYKTTNFDTTGATTWTAVGNGLPDTPINAIMVDPNNSNTVFAGTDIGVYRSIDGGINWNPYSTGLPRVAVFDMAIQNANRLLRIATHGRGIWEIGLDSSVTISGTITGANSVGRTVELTGSSPAPLSTVTDGSGNYSFSGLSVGGNYTVRPVATATVAFTPTNRTYPDIPSSKMGQNFVTTAPPPPIPGGPLVASPGQVIITEFRLRGGVGANDEYVELYNNTNSNITVSTSDGSDGWALDGPVGATRVNIGVVPVGTVIPARGHYLLSASSFSLNARATGDFFYSTTSANGLDDNSGVALYATSNRANFSPGNRLDAAGFVSASVEDREGTGIPNIATNDGDYALVRKLDFSGLYVDTDNNANDFVLVSTTGAVGVTTATLGAPGPENTASPIQRNALIRASFVDPTVSSSLPPNRVRDPLETGVNKNFGTLIIRRRFTNNTGQILTRLRFRIMDITTLNSSGAGPSQADLRALNSGDVLITSPSLTIKGTTVELPPTQALGGGLNTALNVTLPDVVGLNPLVGGSCVTGQCTIDVQFKLGVVQGGTYRFFINVEALP